MKIISFAVPCYNSEAYMRHCIESLLPAGEEAEIIIVDDGSSDGTADIADEYAAKYPSIVKAVHQPNGGHGAAVNTGIENAKGMYYKVVDSDDWLDEESLHKVMNELRSIISRRKRVDLFICNYVYEHVLDHKSHVVKYDNALPENEIFGWSEIRRFRPDQNLLMHSVIYRTKILRACGLKLPEHTFYVDNLFVYVPLPYVKTLYYMNVDLYRYYIGREDQSVNQQVMISRIDQQIKVNELMIDAYDLPSEVKNKQLAKYMLGYLAMICSVTSIMLILANTEEADEKRCKLWHDFKEKRPKTYRHVRVGIRGLISNPKTKVGKKTAKQLYKVSRKIFKFN
ncbi:MAG: glycosyltransferase family 2 protein [Clostridiales bacterium]|nr:glycosyltransferase family 2 protein [Clostridiales bacterium]MDY3746469.1 glycosyltransferase family 2 protein [Lachnospiraceae bacterium]